MALERPTTVSPPSSDSCLMSLFCSPVVCHSNVASAISPSLASLALVRAEVHEATAGTAGGGSATTGTGQDPEAAQDSLT